MNDRLSQFGHIPLNEETFELLDESERIFWTNFISQVAGVIYEKEAHNASKPLTLPVDLLVAFEKAVTVYHGDKYRQVVQIREIFHIALV